MFDFQEILRELDDRIEKENERRRVDKTTTYPKMKILLLGQMGLFAHPDKLAFAFVTWSREGTTLGEPWGSFEVQGPLRRPLTLDGATLVQCLDEVPALLAACAAAGVADDGDGLDTGPRDPTGSDHHGQHLDEAAQHRLDQLWRVVLLPMIPPNVLP